MVPKNVQVLFKVLLKYKSNTTFQVGLFLKALYSEAEKVTKTCLCLLISKIHPNVLWKFIPRTVCDMLREERMPPSISYLQWSLALSLPLSCLNHLFICPEKKKIKNGVG